MLNTFTFNGHSSDEFGIRIEKMPVLNRSARKFLAASVPGHNGNIYQFQDAWEEIVQPYQIFAGNRTGGAVATFTNIMEWLHSADDYVVLSDSYDPTHYRKAVFVDSVDIESEWHTFGRATINFRCRPEHYIVTPDILVKTDTTITNATNHVAKPLITLTGGGAKNLYKFNDKVQGDLGANLTVTSLSSIIPDRDTTLWAARARVSSRPSVILGNTSRVALDSATDINGAVQYTSTEFASGYEWGIGIVLDVQSNADYTIACQASDAGTVYVCLAERSGNNNITRILPQSASGSGWVNISLTFHTSAEEGYAFIIFARDYTGTQFFRNIMINGGTVALPYKAYNPLQSQVSINNIRLSFVDNGFATAVIDCDKEDFSMDGVNANNKVMLTDLVGNLSVDYLQLDVGTNDIIFGGDIVQLNITPRYWNL